MKLHQWVDPLCNCLGIESLAQVGAHMCHMVGIGHEGVSAVSTDHDIAGGIKDRNAIGRRMSLDGAAMGLRLEPRAELVEVVDQSVEPRPDLGYHTWKVTLGPQERGDDSLHPCRAALWRCADEDIA